MNFSNKMALKIAGSFFVFFLFNPLLSICQNKELKRFEYSIYKMGTVFNIIFYDVDSTHAASTAEKAFLRIRELDSLLSDYKENSELNYLSSTAGSGDFIKVSTDLWNVLSYANELSTKTNGAFDVTVGPLVKLWRRARRQYKLPDETKINEAKRSVGFHKIGFDKEGKKVILYENGMQLDLGGIAKGYTADEVLTLLSKNGIKSALVDAGGDVTLGDPPPGAVGWKVELEAPDDSTKKYMLYLSNTAIATSGDLYQNLEINNKRYSHIIDPFTGLGLQDQSKVTIIASSGTLADALASAVSVLGPKTGIKTIKKFKKAMVLISHLEDDKLKVYCSKKMRKILKKGEKSKY